MPFFLSCSGIVSKASVTSMEYYVTVFFSMGGFKTCYTSLFHFYQSSIQLQNYLTDAFVTKCSICIFSFFSLKNLI